MNINKQTEWFLAEFDKFVEENGGVQNETELKALMEKFRATHLPAFSDSGTPETIYDFLELAESAETKKDALKFVKKALEIEPGNLDAESMMIELSSNSMDKCLEKYEKLIAKTEETLKNEGFFDDRNIGEFWLITETRPYMRLLEKYAFSLIDCGKMRLAGEVLKKMLCLNKNDNLGSRYKLMHIHAYLEDEQSAIELFKKYHQDESIQLLLPLSVLYYKLGNLRESEKYLKRMRSVNNGTYNFFNAVLNDSLDICFEDADPYCYRPGTIEEYLEESREGGFLLSQSAAYLEWAWKKLKTYK